MNTHLQKTITSSDKKLLLTVASFSGDINSEIIDIAEEAFNKLAPFLKDEVQALYIRDIPFLAIDQKYPGGHCYNRHEAMIAVPQWPVDITQLKSCINHELHHLARWQNAGYGFSLGGALLSEGIATYYENLESGWIPPWSNAEIPQKAISAAIEHFDSEDYDHGSWFFNGEYGKWVGYSIGFKLAEKLFEEGFDLRKSLEVTPSEVQNLIAEI